MSSRQQKKNAEKKQWTMDDERQALEEISQEDRKRSNILQRMARHREKELELERQRHRQELERRVRDKFLYGERSLIDSKLRQLQEEHEKMCQKQAPKSIKQISVTQEATRVRETDGLKTKHGYSIVYNKIFQGNYWRTLQARRNNKPEELIALTIIDLTKCPNEKKVNLEKDGYRIARFLCHNHHPCLVSTYDIYLVDSNYYIFHEIMQSYLDKFMKHGSHVSEYRASSWGKDLADAIAFLHSHGIVHRNICPKTIWLTLELKVKLGNFGYAGIFYNHKTGRRISMNKIHAAEAEYHPPEEFNDTPYDGTRADVWMWAATVVFMLTKRFLGKEGFEGFQDDNISKISEDGKRLLSHCLMKDPLKRPNISSVSHHIWFKEFLAPKHGLTPPKVEPLTPPEVIETEGPQAVTGESSDTSQPSTEGSSND